MIVAEAPALVPEAAYLVVGLGVVLAWLFLYGAKYGWNYSFGALLRWLADHSSIKFFGHRIGPGNVFENADHAVLSLIGDGIAATEWALAKWWYGQLWVIRELADGLATFAHDVEHAFDVLVNGTLGTVTTTIVRPVGHGLGQLRGTLRTVEGELLGELRAQAHTLEGQLERDFGLAWRGIDALGVRLGGAIGHWADVIEARVADLAHYIYHGVNTRLRLLEQLLAGGLLAAIALEALTRAFPEFQCSNVRRLARGVCKMDAGLLALLLGDAIEALVVADLCEFIWLLSNVARRAQPLLLAFVSVENALIGCHGVTAAPLLRLAPTTVPAQSQGITLAA